MIDNKQSFFTSIILIGIIIYGIFLIFHFYYKGNYCDYLSGEVEGGVLDEIKLLATCEDNYLCKIGESVVNSGGIKKFTCIRSIQPGVWKQ